ncbi:hypothetical protein HGM15179_019706 [Zosterops borbonicus]|uniref:Uncharacterized protein n=1 Tax=Zosterops borbonicus TaxID=364589 RepID=A0A8K1DAY0_9PASS|nr:hypothetical protein HGM15179_019706 [Zosterops borbonicus]
MYNRPIRGLITPVSPTPQDILDHVTQAETLSPQRLRRTESGPEIDWSPDSVGVETGGDSGGAEGGDGQSQVTRRRGRTQGGMRGGDQSDVAAQAEQTQHHRARARSDPEQREYVTHRRAAAHGDTECSPSAAGGKQAPQRLATTASMTTTAAAAATIDRPVQSRSPEPTKCPFPSDSDTDSETSDNQVTAFAAHGRQLSQRQSQRVSASRHRQHSSELHQAISRLAQLSHHHNKQEQQTAASSQPRAQRDHSPFSSPPTLPPVSSVSMPAFTTNPRAAVAKAAVMDGDWDDANALSCPVLITNEQAKWDPYDWKILQKAKETVTT